MPGDPLAGLPWFMAETSIFDDDRTESPDGVSPEAADEQVFPTDPVASADAAEADVLEQARAAPLDEDPRE